MRNLILMSFLAMISFNTRAQTLVLPKIVPLNFNIGLDFRADSMKLFQVNYLRNVSLAIAYDQEGMPLLLFDRCRIYDKNLVPLTDSILPKVQLRGCAEHFEFTKYFFLKSIYEENTYFLFFSRYRFVQNPIEKNRDLTDLCMTKVEYQNGRINYSPVIVVTNDITQFSLNCALHSNGKDFWVVTHRINQNQYASFRIGKNGVVDSVFSDGIASPASSPGNARNDLRISPDGKKIVLVGLDSSYNRISRIHMTRRYFVECSDFDPSTGKISNPNLKLLSYPYFDPSVVSFSPDSRSFYVGFMNPAYLLPVSILHFTGNSFDDIQEVFRFGDGGYTDFFLGSDGKIYGIYELDKRRVSGIFVVQNPNRSGSSRGYHTLPKAPTNIYTENHFPLLPPFYFRPCSINLPDTVHCQEGGAVRLDATHPLARRYTWSTGDTTASVSLSTQGTYTVRLIGPNCDHTDTVRVVMASCSPTVPNVFTPNSDGQNDRWVLDGLDQAGGWRVDITDRWGRIIYHNPRYDNSWDGSGQPEGIYYYHLHSTRLNHSIKGWISLMR